ncbi:MAG: tetratricopeptide repeat protein [Kiritimatiellae bacterium]|nr:tetratricopeptide repeat protein [Kiritimatiellia bacterium]
MPHTSASGRIAAFTAVLWLARGVAADPDTTPPRDPAPTATDPMAEIESAVARIRASYEQLRLRMDEQDRELRRARAARQAAEARHRELEGRVRELEAENISLQARISRLQTDLEEAHRRAELATTEARGLDERLQTVQRDLRRLTQERDELAASLQRERARADEAESDRLRLRAVVRDLERRVRSATEPDAPPPEAAEPAQEVTMPPPAPPPTAEPAVEATTTTLTVAPRPVPEPPASIVATTSSGTALLPMPPAGWTNPPPVPVPVLSATGGATAVAVLTTAAPPSEAAPVPMRLVPVEEVDESRLTQLLLQAATAREERRWEEARTLYEEALRLRPGDPSAATGLAETLLALGDLAAAERQAQQLLAAAPDHPDRLLLAGTVAARRSRHDEAVRYLRRARELAPLRADIARELGSALHDAGRYDEAAATFIAAAGLEPDDSLSWFNAAVCLLKTDPPKRQRAAECYRRAIELGEPKDERIEQRLREPDVAP